MPTPTVPPRSHALAAADLATIQTRAAEAISAQHTYEAAAKAARANAEHTLRNNPAADVSATLAAAATADTNAAAQAALLVSLREREAALLPEVRNAHAYEARQALQAAVVAYDGAVSALRTASQTAVAQLEPSVAAVEAAGIAAQQARSDASKAYEAGGFEAGAIGFNANAGDPRRVLTQLQGWGA